MSLSKPAQLPEPAATGSLGKKPLAHLLIYALDRRLTGTFELAWDGGDGASSVHIVVIEGQILRVATSDPVTYLGHVLYELGFIDDTKLSLSLAQVAGTKRLHGQLLLEDRSITSEQLAEALRQQRGRKLKFAFGLPEGTTFAFYPDVDLIGERPNDIEPLDPLTCLWRAVREHPSWDHVRSTVTRVGGRALRLAGGVTLERLGFDDDERAAAECLRMKPATIPELAIIGGLTIQGTDLLAYFLIIAKQVEIVERVGVSAPPPATAGGSLPPAGNASPSGAPARRASTAALRGVVTPGQAYASGEYVRKISFSMSAVSPDSGTIRIPSPVPPERGPSSGRIPSMPPARILSPTPARPSSPPQGGSQPPGRFSSQPAPRTSSPPVPNRIASAPPRMQSGPPSSPPHPSSMPPSADLARKKSILDRARWIDQEDYFKMLMIPRESSTEEIRAAFLRAAKVWHPDSLPSSISEVRGDCERVFVRITTAYETLVDPVRRKAYERSMDNQAKESAEADQLLSQAEMHLTLGDRLQAEGMVRKALVAAPQNPDAMALLAHLESLDPRRANPERLSALVKVLDMAIGKDPMCKRAHYFRALLKKKQGDHEAAIRDLRVAVTNDPDDVDAQRELKVYETKLRDGTIVLRSFSPAGGTKKPEGFFERLRKK
ncbi:MAG TPA: DnaJ domain-containing protein [Polyangiaceae bacterium]|jgi:curved DNA-binding protein CbpA